MHRTSACLRQIALASCVAIGLVTAVGAAAGPAGAEEHVAGLETRLKDGLRAQLHRDRAFCDRVAEAVRQGRLPVKVVDATFWWAVRRGREYPFPAFEHVLRLKASRLGVTL